MTGFEAYKAALQLGWSSGLEDAVFDDKGGWSYDFIFTINIAGANLVRYINKRIDNYKRLCYWARVMVNCGINKHMLIPGVKGSNLSDIDKVELIRYIELLLVRSVLE